MEIDFRMVDLFDRLDEKMQQLLHD